MLPSWSRSSKCSLRCRYFLATETTSRRLASTRSFLARSASCSPVRMTFPCVLEIGKRRACRGLALTDFLFQLAFTVPGVDANAGLDLLLPLEMRPLFNRALENAFHFTSRNGML